MFDVRFCYCHFPSFFSFHSRIRPFYKCGATFNCVHESSIPSRLAFTLNATCQSHLLKILMRIYFLCNHFTSLPFVALLAFIFLNLTENYFMTYSLVLSSVINFWLASTFKLLLSRFGFHLRQILFSSVEPFNTTHSSGCIWIEWWLWHVGMSNSTRDIIT